MQSESSRKSTPASEEPANLGMMNIDEFRDFCLALGEDVTEKTPFGKFVKRFDSVLVFYVTGHMFCLTDIDNFTFVEVKSTPDEIEEIKQRHVSVGEPINRGMKDWIRLELDGDFSDFAIYALVRRAYTIVKARYRRQCTTSRL